MIRVYTPCPECSELWSSSIIDDSAIYIERASSEIFVESDSFQFFFHPSCSRKHKFDTKTQIDFIENPFSPIHKIECDYNNRTALYHAEASGVFNLDRERAIQLSGQGRDKNKKLAIKKSVYELIERISNVYVSPIHLSEFCFKSEDDPNIKINLNKLIPNGIHGVFDEALPLRYGIAAHDSKSQAIENAKKESLEKYFQYLSLTNTRMELVNENDGIMSLRVEIDFDNVFAVAYEKSNTYPYQLLTSAVAENFESAIFHARSEIIEKKEFLYEVENFIEEYSIDLYPWIYFAKEKNAPDLFKILISGDIYNRQKIDKFLIINRENILTNQIGIFVYQVLLNYDRQNDFRLEFFPYG